MGDINVHSKKWLRHSLMNRADGELLYNICNECGLRQLAREPTHDHYLIDLVLTDIQDLQYRELQYCEYMDILHWEFGCIGILKVYRILLGATYSKEGPAVRLCRF